MRGALLVLLLIAGAVLLAVSERFLAPRVIAGRLPTGEAQWIFAPADLHSVTPLAFQAARDFELAAPPAEARLRLLADEEYVLYLNGARVGGNRQPPGAGLDEYDVAPLLRAGANRLLVEVRSGRRAGGLLLRLSGGGGLEIVTGPDWRILPRYRDAHLDPDEALEWTRAPRVWGGPPTGRWRLPRAGQAWPLHDELVAGGDPLGPERVRVADGDWRRALSWRATRSLRSAGLEPAKEATFDWGREVTGYLGVAFLSRRDPKALLYYGCDAVDRESAPDDWAIGVPGRRHWTSALPRRFRCVTVLAPEGVRGAFAVAVDEERAAPLLEAVARAEEPREGVFGIDDPPPLVTPVEHEIRRQLEGLPGLVGGQPG